MSFSYTNKGKHESINKFNAIDYKTYLTEDELDFVYNGAMEIANIINVLEYSTGISLAICIMMLNQ